MPDPKGYAFYCNNCSNAYSDKCAHCKRPKGPSEYNGPNADEMLEEEKR